jgi:hypothetical protein
VGTDIHIFSEVREKGIWKIAEPLMKNPFWCEDYKESIPEWQPTSLNDSRRYELFAILANVRNPIRSVIPFDYISEPRGLPPNVSKEIRDYYARFGNEAYSASWLLLADMAAFGWHGKEIMRRGIVHPAVAHLFPPGRRGFPFADWPKGVGFAADSGNGVEVKWVETYAEAAGREFMEDSMSKLRSYGRPQDVRVVFWFDS